MPKTTRRLCSLNSSVCKNTKNKVNRLLNDYDKIDSRRIWLTLSTGHNETSFTMQATRDSYFYRNSSRQGNPTPRTHKTEKYCNVLRSKSKV
jgi:hypothetical protein